MLNPDAEINRLRSSLNMRGYPSDLVDALCDGAAVDINDTILDIVSTAVVEASEYAYGLGVEEFVEELDVVETGSGFQITTKSRKTDFSMPETPMLHNLLKNAKTAEDGSKYKVIPMGSDSDKKPVGKTMFSDQRLRQSAVASARAALNENLNINKSARSNSMMQNFKDVLNRNIAARKHFFTLDKPNTGTPKFRTVSSKQDAETQWVMPAREKDLTGYLAGINSRIESDIQTAVTTIIAAYEGEL